MNNMQNKNENKNNIKESTTLNNMDISKTKTDNIILSLEEKQKADIIKAEELKKETEKQNELKRIAEAEADINGFIAQKKNPTQHNTTNTTHKVNIVNTFIKVALIGTESDNPEVLNKYGIKDCDGTFLLCLKVYDILSKNNALIQSHKFGQPPTKRTFKNVWHNILNVVIPRLKNSQAVGRSQKISHYAIDNTFKGFKIVFNDVTKTDIKTDVSPLETPKL
jgi:hypothetical protein